MSEKMIDMSSYPRKEHFDYFRGITFPYVGVTVECDVTDAVGLCRKNGYSFYLTFMHAAAKAADSVPELRRRIRGGGIVEFDACPTSHVELLDDGTFCYCTLYHDLPFDRYIEYAEKTRKQCRQAPTIEEDGDSEKAYFVSTLPWLNYTALVQPVSGGGDSNPRLTWGKYKPVASGRLMMPVSILCHHALVDGLHIAAFYSALERELAALG